MKSKVQEITGVSRGEIFKIKGRPYEYTLTEPSDYLYSREHETARWKPADHMLACIINHPEAIIRVFTEDQRELLQWLQAGGYTQLVYDPEKNQVAAWHRDASPYYNAKGWASSNGAGAVWGEKIECLRPLVKAPDVIVDIDDLLKGCGPL